ncbi:tetratricopeptide repeat protein [Candidatus Fermentibacterales bacterium]|nr:tetratricopeptide repeat protein [Candidatus Fermentibacterales bacterium]
MADAINSDTYDALCREAEEYISQGRMEQARELLLKAISLIGTRSQARSLLADACMSLGLWAEARSQLQVLTTLEIGNVQHHYRLGQVLEELGETLLARDNYRVVLEKDHGHHGASVALNRLPAQDGEKAEEGAVDLSSIFGEKGPAAAPPEAGKAAAAAPPEGAGSEVDLSSVFGGGGDSPFADAGEETGAAQPASDEAPGQKERGLDLEAMFTEEEPEPEKPEPPSEEEKPAAVEQEEERDFQILPDSETAQDVFALDSVPEDVDTLLKELGVTPEQVSSANQEEITALLSSLGIDLPSEVEVEGEEGEEPSRGFDLEKLSTLLGTSAFGAVGEKAAEEGEPAEPEEAEPEEAPAEEPSTIVESVFDQAEEAAADAIAVEAPAEAAAEEAPVETPAEEPAEPEPDVLEDLIRQSRKKAPKPKPEEPEPEPVTDRAEPGPEAPVEEAAEPEPAPEPSPVEAASRPGPVEAPVEPGRPEPEAAAPVELPVPTEPASVSVDQGETVHIAVVQLKSGALTVDDASLIAVEDGIEILRAAERLQIGGKGRIHLGRGTGHPFALEIGPGCALDMGRIMACDALLDVSGGIDGAPGLRWVRGPAGSTVVMLSPAPIVTVKLKGKSEMILRHSAIVAVDGEIEIVRAEGVGMEGFVALSGKGRVHYSS